MTKQELRELQIALAKLWVAGSSITQDMRDAITFLHIEIDDVIDGAEFDRFEVLQ